MSSASTLRTARGHSSETRSGSAAIVSSSSPIMSIAARKHSCLSVNSSQKLSIETFASSAIWGGLSAR